MGLARVWTSLQYFLDGDSEGFSVVSNACLIKKDYNTAVPIREAMFCPLNKAIIVELLEVFAMSKKLLWYRCSTATRPFETRFFKIQAAVNDR